MATQEKTWNVANRLHSLKDSDNPEVNHIIAGADEIYDDEKGAKQSDINAQTDAALADRYTKAETYSKEQLDSLITTPDVEYVTVATFADLPQPGEANTIYRVSSYDGSQVDASKYALYAWNGATYQLLAVRSAVGEVFDVSEYNSGATYETLAAALAAVPESVWRGGMSIKFVQISDNNSTKYVQYRYTETATTAATFANVANWQGIDNEPTAGSDNLVKSGGVRNEIVKTRYYDDVNLVSYNASQRRAYVYGNFKAGDIVEMEVTGGTTTSTGIIVRYDDLTTTIIGTSSNVKHTVILTKDTSFVVVLLNENNITVDGNFVFHCKWGKALDFEKLLYNYKDRDIDVIPILGSNNLVESNAIAKGFDDIYKNTNDVPALTDRAFIEGGVGTESLVPSLTNSERKHIRIDVTGNNTMTIQAGSAECLFVALKHYPTSINEVFDFADNSTFGSRKTVPANRTQSFSLPAETRCILIYIVVNGTLILPKSITIDGVTLGNSYLQNILFLNKNIIDTGVLIDNLKAPATVDSNGMMSSSDKLIIDRLSESLGVKDDIVPVSEDKYAGYFVNQSGIFTQSQSYSCVNKTILLKTNERIVFKSSREVADTVAVISSCPFSGTANSSNIGATTGVYLTPLNCIIEDNTYSYTNVSDEDMNIILCGFTEDISSGYTIIKIDVSGSSQLYEKKGDTIYNDGDTVFTFTDDNTTPGFINRNGTIESSSTYRYSDYIYLNEGTYQYNGILTGNASIVIYTIGKVIWSVISGDSTNPTINIGSGGRYVRVSVKQRPATLIAKEDIIKYSNVINYSRIITKNDERVSSDGNSLTINELDLGCGVFRLSVDFTIDGYAEVEKNVQIAQIGNVSIDLNGALNSLLSYSPEPSTTVVSTYPHPQRNVKFSISDGVVTNSTKEFSFPYHREIIGDDLFTIQYVGEIKEHLLTQYNSSIYDVDNEDTQTHLAALSDKMILSYKNGILKVSVDSTDYISLNLSQFSTIQEVVDYINNNYSDFFASIQNCDGSRSVSEIADIEEVCLVSIYPNSHPVVYGDRNRYDAFPCYFQSKIDKSVHNIEITNNKGILNAVVDGIPLCVAGYVNLEDSDTVILGNNDNDIPISIKDFRLDVGTLADAEPLDNGRIISNYNPSVVILEGHGMWAGSECDGLVPIFKSQTPASGQANIVPDKYDGVIQPAGSSVNIAMSTSRYRRICALAKERGYEYIKMANLAKVQTGKLPKRCWTICFDDREEYIFKDLDIRGVMGETGINPCLAISASLSFPYDENRIETHRRMLLYGWELVQHGLGDMQTVVMSSAQLYDKTSKLVNYSQDAPSDEFFNPRGYYRRFGCQMDEAEMYRVNMGVWVYSNGQANPNVFKAFKHSGVAVGVGIDLTAYPPNDGQGNVDRWVSRGSNQYLLRRLNISDADRFSKLEALML